MFVLKKKSCGLRHIRQYNLNIVMKVLTAITIVMAIPNMVFSYYGMNVSALPVPTWWVPILIAIVASGIVAAVLVKNDMFK